MAYHYNLFSSFITVSARFRSGYLPVALLLLSGLSWGQCFKSTPDITVKDGNIAIGDFNGDGRPDFVTTRYGSDSIAIFLNQGSGLFDKGTHFFLSRGADSLAVGDINADGKLDVAITDATRSVAILLGDGKGRLAAGAALQINGDGVPALGVLISDFNVDGYPDLAVTGLYDSVTILLNNGQAGFGKGVKYSAGKSTQIRATKTGDFNGDGKPDLILLQDNDKDYFVSLLLNNGAGSFSAATIIRNNAFKNANTAEVGDFNTDGKPDLLVSGDTLLILSNNGNNGFIVNKLATPNTGNYRPRITVGDFNGDSKLDLVFPGQINYSIPGYLLSGKGDGSFAAPVSFDFAGPYSGFLTGDFDSNGRTDLLANTGSKVSVLLNCTVPINTPPKLTFNDSQTATVGMPFAYTVNAFTDAETPNSLAYSASLSPANGLSFDPATRLVSGTPSMTGVTSVTVTATDPGGLSAATSFSITAKPPLILGVEEPGTSQFMLSPNPVTDMVQVTLTNAYRDAISVRVMSAGGQSVRTLTSVKTGETWRQTLSVQGLPPGSYYLSLYQNGQQTVGRFLKL